MPSILVVCTGNVCRSPIAAGFLEAALERRWGDAAPLVASAGTAGWEGSSAMEESVVAAAERDVDISGHVARRLMRAHVEAADLVVCMATEHRDAVARAVPGAEMRAFTLKELVRLLDALPPPEPADDPALTERVAAANQLRRSGFDGNPYDEDVVDPLGMPLENYRAVAWELDEWGARLIDGLYGKVPAPAATRDKEEYVGGEP